MDKKEVGMSREKSVIVSATEFLLLTLMLISNYDLIISTSVEDWLPHVSKQNVLIMVILTLAFLHFAELGKRARHRSMYFREASSQGLVVGTVVPLSMCMQHFKIFQKILGEEDHAASMLTVYKNYSIAMNASTLFYGVLYLLNIDVMFVAPVIMLSLGFLQDHFTDVNFIVPLGSVVLYFIIFFGLIKLCPKSFTIAEGAVISQGATLMMIDFTILLVLKSGYKNLLHGYGLEVLEGRPDESLALESLLTSTIIISVCLSPVFYCLAWYAKTNKDTMIYSIAFYVGGIMNTFAIFIPVTYIILGMNPIWAIASLITPSIAILVAWWILLLVIAITIVVWNTVSNIPKEKQMFPNIIIRKFFHFIAVLIFVPGIHVAPNFTKLASGSATVVLIICEYLRIFKIYPCGQLLQKYLVSFVDERDSGKVLLTHIYLLFGVSLPIWLFTFNTKPSPFLLLPYSGVIALGIGDSFASIIGRIYGQSKIPGSSKTYLGAIACIISQFITSILLMICVAGYISLHDAVKILIGVSFTAAMECVTSQIDNLILSPVLYAIFSFLFNG